MAPLSVEKGIRQGCPLSGLLYSIAIEPFLNRLRGEVRDDGFRMPGAHGYLSTQTTSPLLSPPSAALAWSEILTISLPVDRMERPAIEVHLGNTKTYTDKSLNICKTRLIETLASWSGISTSLSFKGRVLIVNQLAASKMFHCLAALTPPDDFLSELQQRLVDFVWSNKRHLLKAEIVYQKPDKGGFGLVNLQARVLTFRLSRIFRYLKCNSHHSFDFWMPSLYGEIVHAWRLSGARLEIIHDSVNHVLNLPIDIPLIQNVTDEGAPHITRLSARGVGLVRDLLNFTSGSWHQPNHVISSPGTSRPPSSRLLQKTVFFYAHDSNQFVPLSVRREGISPPCFNTGKYLFKTNVTINNMDSAISAPSKALYNVINTNLNSHPSNESSH